MIELSRIDTGQEQQKRRTSCIAQITSKPMKSTNFYVIPLAPPDWEVMEYACTDNNKDLYDGHLQPGTLDGSGRDGSALATPPPQRQ